MQSSESSIAIVLIDQICKVIILRKYDNFLHCYFQYFHDKFIQSFIRSINSMADSLPVMPESPVMLKKKRSIDREITKRRTIVNLNAQQLGDEGILYLTSKALDHISTIKLWKNGITHQGAACLNFNEWDSLKNLYLNSNQIGNRGCKYLARGNWNSLEVLSLYANEIDNCGCGHLAKKNWRNLKELSLDNNRITSFNELNRIEAENLTKIVLDLNPITYPGYISLLKSGWSQAEEVNLINNFFREKSVVLRTYLRQKYANLKGISF